MNECPKCGLKERQVKVGRNRSGSQRWQCQQCGQKYTPEPTEHGYPDELRRQAVKLYVDGMNYRRIGRQLRVDHKSVMHWVKAYTDQLPAAPVPDRVRNAELDELFTFVGEKKTSSM